MPNVVDTYSEKRSRFECIKWVDKKTTSKEVSKLSQRSTHKKITKECLNTEQAIWTMQRHKMGHFINLYQIKFYIKM